MHAVTRKKKEKHFRTEEVTAIGNSTMVFIYLIVFILRVLPQKQKEVSAKAHRHLFQACFQILS